MKAVAIERDKHPAARARAARRRPSRRPSLRQEPKAYMKQVVERFKLGEWLGTRNGQNQARTWPATGAQHAEIAFLFFRLVLPIGFMSWPRSSTCSSSRSWTSRRLFVIGDRHRRRPISASRRRRSSSRTRSRSGRRRSGAAWPDALDLLLICVESGMSIEQAFRRVSVEIGSQSVAAGRGARR